MKCLKVLILFFSLSVLFQLATTSANANECTITDGEYMAFIGDGEDFGSDKKYAYSIGSPEDQVWDAESDDFKTAVKELVKAVSKYKKKMLEKQN